MVATSNYTKKNIVSSDFRADLLHPTKGDLIVLENEDAVIRSIKNILFTNTYERPFRPNFGGNITGMLFENVNSFTAADIKNKITNAIRNYEPRASLIEVIVTADPDNNAYNTTIIFSVINRIDPVVFTTILNRVR